MNSRKFLVSLVLLIFCSLVYVVEVRALCTQEPGPAESLKRGKETFEKVISAMGGAEKINKIKNISTKTENIRITLSGERLKMDAASVIEYPDKLWYTIAGIRGQVIMAVDGDEGWILIPPKPMEPMSEQDIQSEIAVIQRDPFYIYRNLDQYNIQLLGEKDVAGTMALDLHITGPTEFHLFIDPKTYLLTALSYVGTIPNRPEVIERVEIYSDYKEVDGIKMAFRVILNSAGKRVVEATLRELKFNIETGKDFFKVKKK